MHRTLPAIAVITFLSCHPALAAGHGSVPPESFLKYSVGNVREMGQEVTVLPIVRARLAQHFHVSYAEIGRYVLHNLTLSKLGSAGYYRVACIRPDGSEYWIKSRLAAGTPVFTSRVTGQPILKLACGNPMVSLLPPVQDNPKKLAAPRVAQTRSALAQTADTAPTLMAEAPPADMAPMGTQDLFVDQTPVVKTAGSLEFSSLAPASGLAGLGPALAAVAAIGIATAGGGHHGSSPSPPNPVPEASSSALFGSMLLIGGGVWMLRRKRLA